MMKKLSMTLKFNLLVALLLILASCSKKNEDIRLEVSNTKNAPIAAHPFDWETATYMPTNPANVVPVPWQGPVGGIDGDIANDYHSTEGWELVYNTFNPNVSPYVGQLPPGGLYFALYNKFRGLLRFYLYIPEGTATPTSSIAHGLSLYPQGILTSSSLNFGTGDVIDIDVNNSSILKTSSQQLNLMGNWIAAQYEIAYDPNLQNTSFPNLGLQWTARTLNITDISLKGTQVGTVSGTVSTPASGFNLESLVSNLAKGQMQLSGMSEINRLKAKAPAGSSLSTLLNSLSSTVTGFLNGNVSGVFSAIFGKNGSSQRVNLDLNTEIVVTGTAINSVGITNPFFVISGQSNATTANGLIPAYNVPLGVFNLTAKPEISYTFHRERSGSPRTGFEVVTEIRNIQKPTSLAHLIVYNPAIINSTVASAEVIKEDLIFIPAGITADIRGSGGAQIEMINNNRVFINPMGFNFGPVAQTFRVAWRYTIKITPKNGSPAVNIVKTFLVKSNVTHTGLGS